MEPYENRIVNGLLKEADHIETPGDAHLLLSRGINIYFDRSRLGTEDLGPCAWALASALSKQFFGKIRILYPDLKSGAEYPSPFSSRIQMSDEPLTGAISIGLGVCPPVDHDSLWGDARANKISFGQILPKEAGGAHAISGFALAGYLAFAALACAAKLPAFQEDYAKTVLELPFDPDARIVFPTSGLAFLGLGQLGQAYLALLYFMSRRSPEVPRILLVDHDNFERPNEFTQILLSDSEVWNGLSKAQYLRDKTLAWGWEADARNERLDWEFRAAASGPRLALLGFDNFDARRIAIGAGFEWLIDSGIGSSLSRPRITWHSLPPSRAIATALFPHDVTRDYLVSKPKDFYEGLRRTPGGCGWHTFNSITASAPSIGLVAAAFACSELASVLANSRNAISGSAYIWSPLLPYLRRPVLPDGTVAL
jgi:hypothetical protein